jgi:hypothetical protein
MPTRPIGAPPNWIDIGIPGYRFATKLEKIRNRQRRGEDEGGNEKADWYETIVPGMDRAIRDAIGKWWQSAELRDTYDRDKPHWIGTKIAKDEFLRIKGREPNKSDLGDQIAGAPTGITYRSFIFVVREYIRDIVGKRTSTPSIGKAPPLSWPDGLVWPQGSHDHVAHPPAATADPAEDADAAGKAETAAAGQALGKVGQQLGAAGKATAQAAKEFRPQVLEAVLGIFDGLVYIVSVPLEWIYDILRLDVATYGQKPARVARALELIANQGPDGDATELIRNLAKAAINGARSDAVKQQRTLKAAKALQRKLEANKTFKAGTYAKGGESSRYKAALGKLKALAGDDFDSMGATTAEALKTPVKNFIARLETEMATGVYGKTPVATELESYKKIRQSLERVKALLQNTDRTAIEAKITEMLPPVKEVAGEATTEPTAGGAGLVGPFATAACVLAADPTGCGCGGTKAGMWSSSDDGDSDSDEA